MKFLKSLTKLQWLAQGLIVVGLIIMGVKALGMREFNREVQYAIEHDFASGNVSPDLLRPWMSIRYIAVAYAVPQEYLYDAAHIQPRKETSMIGINRLNQQMNLGQVDGQPALMKTLHDAIDAYRANPVSPGLLEGHVEDWMNVQYIANSTGIPAGEILIEVGIPVDGNSYKPLGFLSDEVDYNGGPSALVAAIQKIVDARGVKPVRP